MKISLNDVLFAFSYALDCVEGELLAATAGHGKRVAYLAVVLGAALGLDAQARFDLASCAVLHDNALTEYLRRGGDRARFVRGEAAELAGHCLLGEKNIGGLRFYGDVSGAILYHHENADGSGPFGKTAAQTPLMAQLIHFADVLDVSCDLGSGGEGKAEQLAAFLAAGSGTLFAPELVALFRENFSALRLNHLQGEGVDALLQAELPALAREDTDGALLRIAEMFATIIDYKSESTGVHSLGVAQRALRMAREYGYDEESAQKLYLAGAVHDIGKLVISRDILEKPSGLNAAEYENIQTHAWYSYFILRRIRGFEEITRWASYHHEKLDGSGYPFGKKAAELGEKERLMACLDVYQALTEERSYKKSLSHQTALRILRQMVASGGLDGKIVEDIDRVFADGNRRDAAEGEKKCFKK